MKIKLIIRNIIILYNIIGDSVENLKKKLIKILLKIIVKIVEEIRLKKIKKWIKKLVYKREDEFNEDISGDFDIVKIKETFEER